MSFPNSVEAESIQTLPNGVSIKVKKKADYVSEKSWEDSWQGAYNLAKIAADAELKSIISKIENNNLSIVEMTGPPGPMGIQGRKGQRGEPGESNYTTYDSTTEVTVLDSETKVSLQEMATLSSNKNGIKTDCSVIKIVEAVALSRLLLDIIEQTNIIGKIAIRRGPVMVIESLIYDLQKLFSTYISNNEGKLRCLVLLGLLEVKISNNKTDSVATMNFNTSNGYTFIIRWAN